MNLSAMIDAVDNCILAGSQKGWKDGASHVAQFYFPSAMTLHKDTNVLYVCDERNNAVRIIQKLRNGELNVSTLKCSDLESPEGICIDYERNSLIVSNSAGHCIVEFNLDDTSKWSILAGAVRIGGWIDGTLASSRFKTPTGLTIDCEGCVYVCDTHNEKIRKINRKLDMVSTIAGSITGCLDGPCNEARFSRPSTVRLDIHENLLVADTNNHRLRFIDLKKNEVSTLAGSDEGNRDGPLEEAKFKLIYDFTIGKSPNEIWLCDSGNSRVKKIDLATKQVYTIDNFLEQTYGMVMDRLGNLIVASYWHSLVYKIVLCRPLEWEKKRLLWIGNLKEDPSTCYLARLSGEIIVGIIRCACVRMKERASNL